MTTKTFDFKTSSRWTLIKMMVPVLAQKRLTLAWQEDVDQSNIHIEKQADKIDIEITERA